MRRRVAAELQNDDSARHRRKEPLSRENAAGQCAPRVYAEAPERLTESRSNLLKKREPPFRFPSTTTICTVVRWIRRGAPTPQMFPISRSGNGSAEGSLFLDRVLGSGEFIPRRRSFLRRRSIGPPEPRSGEGRPIEFSNVRVLLVKSTADDSL